LYKYFHSSIYYLKANVPELERSRDRRDWGHKQQAKKGETTDIKLPCLLDLEEISLVEYSSIDEGIVNSR